jgi:hypothetical protein
MTKRTDGGFVLRCVRADGSATWQKQQAHAAFFALHDLTHFAVESTLDYERGFFGLIAQGWEIEDTTGKGKRGRLPHEAVEVEHIVGAFDRERASGVFVTAEDFNSFAASQAASAGRPAPRPLTEEEIQRIRARRGELMSQWLALPPGETLELRYA